MGQNRLHLIRKRVETGVVSLLRPVSTHLKTKTTRRWASALTILSMGAIVGSALLFQVITPASADQAQVTPAVQARPVTDTSYYMNTSSTSKANTLGCDQGKTDAAHHSSSEVILDFGAQTSNGSGALFPGGSISISNAQIRAASEHFAAGYMSCTKSHHDTSTFLFLGIGTNNSGANVGSGIGKDWSHLISAVKSFNGSHKYARVETLGANDIETWCGSGCRSAAAAKNWATGFDSVSGNSYIFFGSADGCSETATNGGGCQGSAQGWSQAAYWSLSSGNRAASLPTPQIYNSAQAKQWEMISRYGALHHNADLVFGGPLDQHDINSGCCSGANNTAAQAWSQLWSDLHAHKDTAESLSFSIQIRHE
jgi:hypothetical protein